MAGSVDFDADYRDVPSLTALIQSCAAVVLPYDSREQATSGVLVDAVAAGRPVIATAFPHAVELLSSGAGIVVDHDDPDALVRRPVADPHRAGARRGAWRRRRPGSPRAWAGPSSRRPTSPWPIASSPSARRSYDRTPPPRFDHLLSMTDRRGTFEHAKLGSPRLEHGYCTDDMARVLVVATRERRRTPEVQGLEAQSVRFLRDAQARDGRYRNRMDRRGRWQDEASLEDCWGRSIWALGTAAAHADAGWMRRAATAELERAARRRSPWPRAMAYAALGAAELLSVAARTTAWPARS